MIQILTSVSLITADVQNPVSTLWVHMSASAMKGETSLTAALMSAQVMILSLRASSFSARSVRRITAVTGLITDDAQSGGLVSPLLAGIVGAVSLILILTVALISALLIVKSR